MTRAIDTTCPYCGVGCGVTASVDGSRLVGVAGTQTHPANLGRLCVKGSALHETMGDHGRLLHPQIAGCRTDWATALDAVAGGFSDIIRRHGPDSVAFYLSGQLLTEDYYVANKLMKGFIGSANVDTNSRLCMASAVAGYKRAFGADAVPCSYEDLESCDLLVMVGSNAAWTHPVLFQRISAAKAKRPHMRVVVIDPRRTATCEIADLHLAIAPGSDGFIFTGLLHYLARRGKVDQHYIDNFTTGYADTLAACPDLNASAVATGLDPAELEQFYQWFAGTERTVSFYSQGVNQSATGTDKCNAIINCHLATGRIGKPGMGPLSITGQPNAMGGREVGGLANQLASHMDFLPGHVERVGRFWKSPRMAASPGLKAVDMFRSIAEGKIRAVWIMATNPVVSLPDSHFVREALKRCELVVVSDCISHTDTTACADILLPAQGWGEKDGTVTNSERRISRQRQLIPAPGEAKPDWWIISEVAARMGFGEHFSYPNAAAIFREHARLSGFENGTDFHPQRIFNIAGLAEISDEQYDVMAPVQWPVKSREDAVTGTPRLFCDNRYLTDDEKARFIPIAAELPVRDPLLPFLLNTGRLRDQWHTMTRTARSPRLLNHTDAPFLALNARDALGTGIRDGDLVRMHNGNGSLLILARTEPGQRNGEVFSPIHWNDQYSSHGIISELIPSIVDPHSGQPQSKFAGVRLERVTAACWAHAVSRSPLDVSALDYWVKIPVEGGWRYLLASLNDSAGMTEWLQRQGGGMQRIEFCNPAATDFRLLLCNGREISAGVFIRQRREKLPDAESLTALLSHSVDSETWRLLATQNDRASTSRIICSCHQVTEESILTEIGLGADSPEALGRRLKCGTNCGSCVPELQQILRRTGQTTSPAGEIQCEH